MIGIQFYSGQGLGNQLWNYFSISAIAKRHSYDLCIVNPHLFKGNELFTIEADHYLYDNINIDDYSKRMSIPSEFSQYYEVPIIRHPLKHCDITPFDSTLMNLEDGTFIDGNLQNEKYLQTNDCHIFSTFKHPPNQRYKNLEKRKSTCIIVFRGGEYRSLQNTFLPYQYWKDSMQKIQEIDNNVEFIVVTDDVRIAKRYFPRLEIKSTSLIDNFLAITKADFIITANTSFTHFAARLNRSLRLCIAPKYWWAYNISDGYWACDGNLVKEWIYLDRFSTLHTYEECTKQLNEYKSRRDHYYYHQKIDCTIKLVISSFNNNISWVPKVTENYIVYLKGSTGIKYYGVDNNKIINQPNYGYNIFDYLQFIIDNYDNLPQKIAFCKGNCIGRHFSLSYFNQSVQSFDNLVMFDINQHSPKWPAAFCADGNSYLEVNNSWFINKYRKKYFDSTNNFLTTFLKNPVLPKYVRFGPGANFLVHKHAILFYPKSFYEVLKTIIQHDILPAEAHILERVLPYLWSTKWDLEDLVTPTEIKETVIKSIKRKLSALSKLPKSFIQILMRAVQKLQFRTWLLLRDTFPAILN